MVGAAVVVVVGAAVVVVVGAAVVVVVVVVVTGAPAVKRTGTQAQFGFCVQNVSYFIWAASQGTVSWYCPSVVVGLKGAVLQWYSCFALRAWLNWLAPAFTVGEVLRAMSWLVTWPYVVVSAAQAVPTRTARQLIFMSVWQSV